MDTKSFLIFIVVAIAASVVFRLVINSFSRSMVGFFNQTAKKTNTHKNRRTYSYIFLFFIIFTYVTFESAFQLNVAINAIVFGLLLALKDYFFSNPDFIK